MHLYRSRASPGSYFDFDCEGIREGIALLGRASDLAIPLLKRAVLADGEWLPPFENRRLFCMHQPVSPRPVPIQDPVSQLLKPDLVRLAVSFRLATRQTINMLSFVWSRRGALTVFAQPD